MTAVTAATATATDTTSDPDATRPPEPDATRPPGPATTGSGGAATPSGPDAATLRADPVAWDAFVAGSANGSFPQLTAWAEANAVKGWSSTRLAVDRPAGPVGAQVLLHRMRPGRWTRGYAPRGPVAATLDRDAIEAFTRAVRQATPRLRLTHIDIDPEVDAAGPVPGWLREEGWTPTAVHQIDRTRIIDLRQSEAELWSDLRSSGRWSVNKARRTGYTVAQEDVAGLAAFEALYRETAARVGFSASAAFRDVFAAFARRGGARLLLARAPDGTPAATLMLLDCGDRVIELYGASSRVGSADRANYLVKWEAIRASAERGMARYDLWGTDEEGVATFKASFGGGERAYIGAWRLVTDPRAERLLGLAVRARGAAGSLRRRIASRG
jgi:lipid II:glycine glycyltransferase (peptidoglycan interpeptide bridge formation enzyme)